MPIVYLSAILLSEERKSSC